MNDKRTGSLIEIALGVVVLDAEIGLGLLLRLAFGTRKQQSLWLECEAPSGT